MSEVWKAAYEAIFSDEIFSRCCKLMEEINDGCWDWYDPDTTYESDTRAFVKSVEETVRSSSR
jgi:hypothetical protein